MFGSRRTKSKGYALHAAGGALRASQGVVREPRVDVVVRWGLVGLLLWSVLAFGAVERGSYLVIELGVIVLLTLWGLGRIWTKPEADVSPVRLTPHASRLALPLLLFLGVGALQLLPLPEGILRLLSPEAARLYADFSASGGAGLEGVASSGAWSLAFDRHAALTELLRLGSYVGVFFLALVVLREPQDIRRLLHFLILAGVVLALVGLFQKATAPSALLWIREVTVGSPMGPFVNRNNFANYLGMLLPLALGAMFVPAWRPRRGLYALAAGVMAVGIVFSLSRAGVMGPLIMGGFVGVWLWFRGTRRRLASVGILAVALFLYLLHLGLGPVIERFAEMTAGDFLVREGRWTAWMTTLEMSSAFPAFGVGLGNFRWVFPLYMPLELGVGGFWTHAHNEYLELLAEAGIVGALPLLWFAWRYGKEALVKFRERRDPEVRALALGTGMGLGVMLLHCVVEFHLHIPANAILFAVLAALTWNVLSMPARKPPSPEATEPLTADDRAAELEEELGSRK
jgi:O-antigen ligase